MNDRTIHQDTPQDIPKDTPQYTSHTLSLDVYRKLEAQIGYPSVGPTTSAIQSGFQLGVQHVLRLLRSGFVVGA